MVFSRVGSNRLIGYPHATFDFESWLELARIGIRVPFMLCYNWVCAIAGHVNPKNQALGKN